ncbi:tRNA N6-adenosine threonylcarbamoyltransferase [Anaplasma phagocytophilum]|uniref:tRNA N6-adenosine threonylcarbamoyltransferase n=1 Tax=Anaplasma phagocytophilum TaxID=948 RepID=A0AA45UTV3_ANAPH|nr:tRNA (adenosine(37)-N6)-threonylcarbamoyltransferase complex transferase subunit TsaD [Anaplasma phagocytophilum]SBO14475.1 tRNA N6-adenosine threonylcarbamoyltransferase [Anaplasma phagocytophilum]
MGEVLLGIETSCDETAVAILTDGGEVFAHEVLSQVEHSAYGGVVPEIAARAHYDFLQVLVKKAMSNSGLKFDDLSSIAVTAGPGLVGSLIVGVMFAKAVSYATKKPIIAVNHLEAHALVARMNQEIVFPFLVLIVSGGHCQFMLAHDVGCYSKLGGAIDDSLGEAFDKVARMLGLGYPGGPVVECKAKNGRGDRFFFPRALHNRPGCDFSFSGLKTAVRYAIEREGPLDEEMVCDICASFQECVGDILVSRIRNAIKSARQLKEGIDKLVVTGGVASNGFLRTIISQCAEDMGVTAVFPPRELCTDNGIMVAWAGVENFRKGNAVASLGFAPRARWPMESIS